MRGSGVRVWKVRMCKGEEGEDLQGWRCEGVWCEGVGGCARVEVWGSCVRVWEVKKQGWRWRKSGVRVWEVRICARVEVKQFTGTDVYKSSLIAYLTHFIQISLIFTYVLTRGLWKWPLVRSGHWSGKR